MAVFTTTHHHLCLLFSLSSLIFFAHARLYLDPSDYVALSLVQHDLGINGQRLPSKYPCNNPGIFCERRLSENNTYVLKITRLIFKSKQLAGFISSEIGKLSELREISLADNNLVDQLPAQIVDCKKLEILDLGNNKFSGDVPYQLSTLIRLRFLDLSSNKFSGNLSFLKYFPNLETLSLGNNLFTGKIPKSIRSFRNLQSFDFSGNRFLEGPEGEMNKVDLSDSDMYPKRYIFAESPKTNSSKQGRAAGPTASSNAAAPGPASAVAKKHNHSNRKLWGWILGFLVGAIAGSLCGFVFSVMFKLILAAIRGGTATGPVIYSQLIKRAEDLAFLEKEDGLASLEMIGRGGCGEVYKAELPGSEGKMIAVKKIIQPPKEAADISEEDSKMLNKKMRQIKSEINTSTNEMSLIRWMRNVMTSDNPSQAIDPKLIGNGFEEQMLLVLKIACFCTLDDPKQRPNSKDARCMLAQIKH
ncbi:hypothetical protein ACFE04_028653 [Oxalis oulophora]